MDAHKAGLEVFASNFVNDIPLSYNYSYDPIREYLQFVDNGVFAVDGVLSDNPITPSVAFDCLSNLKKNKNQGRVGVTCNYPDPSFPDWHDLRSVSLMSSLCFPLIISSLVELVGYTCPYHEMDLFAFIQHADSTKGACDDIVNQGNDDGTTADYAEQSGPVVQIEGIDIKVDAETQALVADKPKKVRKRKTTDGASGFGLPPMRLREDHGTFGDASASTDGKSLAALQYLLDKSTLAAGISVPAAATVPFVTFSVTPTPEHECGGHADSVSTANLQTKRPAERFIISSDTPHDSSPNAADDEVSSVVKSIVPDPAVLTTTIATTVVAGTSVPLPRGGDEPTRASIFADFTS
ncbi:hypothetical protein Tco_0829186 [Tanacetum coccineum]